MPEEAFCSPMIGGWGLPELFLYSFLTIRAFFVGDHAPTVVKLAVEHMPSSGKPSELLHAAKIDADAIAEAVKSLL